MKNEQIGELVSIMIRIPILCFTLKKKKVIERIIFLWLQKSASKALLLVTPQ